MEEVKFDLEIFNPRLEVADGQIKNFLDRCYRYLVEKNLLASEKVVVLSVALVDETEMKKLNQQYRGKDDSTDVLSFCYENSAGELNGELVLCVAVIKKNAQQDGSAFELEFRKNLAHGFLHILGFEHSDEMFAWQKEMAEIEF